MTVANLKRQENRNRENGTKEIQVSISNNFGGPDICLHCSLEQAEKIAAATGNRPAMNFFKTVREVTQ